MFPRTGWEKKKKTKTRGGGPGPGGFFFFSARGGPARQFPRKFSAYGALGPVGDLGGGRGGPACFFPFRRPRRAAGESPGQVKGSPRAVFGSGKKRRSGAWKKKTKTPHYFFLFAPFRGGGDGKGGAGGGAPRHSFFFWSLTSGFGKADFVLVGLGISVSVAFYRLPAEGRVLQSHFFFDFSHVFY